MNQANNQNVKNPNVVKEHSNPFQCGWKTGENIPNEGIRNRTKLTKIKNDYDLR